MEGAVIVIDGKTLESVRESLWRRVRRLRDPSLCPDELVDETVLRLLAASQSRDVHSPLAYALRILQNMVRDQIREIELARQALETRAKALGETGPDPARGDGHDDEKLVIHLLEHSDLSRLQKKVIDMIYLQGMACCDVARELSRNRGTIARHRDRALKKMARCASRLGVER
jgi:RNA polymerase sigma factor (sigma-70 family)